MPSERGAEFEGGGVGENYDSIRRAFGKVIGLDHDDRIPQREGFSPGETDKAAAGSIALEGLAYGPGAGAVRKGGAAVFKKVQEC